MFFLINATKLHLLNFKLKRNHYTYGKIPAGFG
jgi:hypothetical protein